MKKIVFIAFVLLSALVTKADSATLPTVESAPCETETLLASAELVAFVTAVTASFSSKAMAAIAAGSLEVTLTVEPGAIAPSVVDSAPLLLEITPPCPPTTPP